MGQALPYPLMTKSLARTSTQNGTLSIGSAEMQGWRLDMEDEIHIRPQINYDEPGTSLLAVYDGHNGAYCSAYLRDEMGSALEDLKDPHNGADLKTAFNQLDAKFLNPDAGFHSTAGSTAVVAIVNTCHGREPAAVSTLDPRERPQKSIPAGAPRTELGAQEGRSTVSTAGSRVDSPARAICARNKKGEDLVKEKKSSTAAPAESVAGAGQDAPAHHRRNSEGFRITIANVGDSKAILIRKKDDFEELTVDHKPDSEDEMARIAKAGGVVLRKRVNGDLAVSRAFGDSRHKGNSERELTEQVVIATPDITTCTARKGDMLLLACDGIFEQLDPSQVADFVREEVERVGTERPDLVAARLIDWSLFRGSKDNMSVVVAIFREDPKPCRPTAGMQYMAGRFVEWKDHDSFVQAYNSYSYSCGVVGGNIQKLAPPKCEALEFLTRLKISGSENPFGVVMIIVDYLQDTCSYLTDVDQNRGFGHSKRNHIEILGRGTGSCCSIQ
mmetsp:Transcript_31556/g.61814  ORF Transcript_31556/g.61814 Transcript_31556/m.61814 type:complete len:500 (-) Transcript_31556:161-1660(-)